MTWPKSLPELSAEQQQIREDFVRYWHEVLPRRYGAIERFNHRYVLRHAPLRGRTLEIGSGLGEHLHYEDLSAQEYHALELRPELAATIRETFPQVDVVVADCQKPFPFASHSFDRIIAVHVLEHLPNLPATLDEVGRLLAPGGRFAIVIPCEGGAAYTLARRLSAQRIFEKRYETSYDWFVASEHVNRPREMLSELQERFRTVDATWFPFQVASVDLNLVIGATFAAR